MNIIITMAGEGFRFKKAGFNVAKHEIEVKGKTLFEWALLSLVNFFDQRFIFVCRKSHNTVKFIQGKSKLLGIEDIKIKEVNYLTKGQAATVLEAEESIVNLKDKIMIYNIDTYVEPEQLRPEFIKGEGWVPAFKAEGGRWSFLKFDNSLRVTEITEKIRMSEFGTIGLYYFRSFDLFKFCYNKYKFDGFKEEYIAPLYNIIIDNPSMGLYTHLVDENSVHVLGTPQDIIEFDPAFSKRILRNYF